MPASMTNRLGLRPASLALELVVVVLGILIAFQVDRWAEERRDRDREYSYLVRLKEDVQLEIEQMLAALEFAGDRLVAIELLEGLIADPDSEKVRSVALPIAIEKATWRSWPQIDGFVYNELQSTGNLGLIRSDTLRRSLSSYYATLSHFSRVGLDFEMQHDFDRLTAGILTTAELRNIEDNEWNSVSSIQITHERGREIIQALITRPRAVEFLPNIAQHHIFVQKVVEDALARARAIVDDIDTLLSQADR